MGKRHNSHSRQSATKDAACVDGVGAGGINHDEEAPFSSPPRIPQPMPTSRVHGATAAAPKASSKNRTLVAGDGDAYAEGFEIGIDMNDDEAPPIHARQFEDIERKTTTKMKGSIEQVPDSAPSSYPGRFSALGLTGHEGAPKMKGSKCHSIQCALASPPVSEEIAAAAHDDSLGLARLKRRQNKIMEPEAEDKNDAQPHLSPLSSVFTENRRNREDIRSTWNFSGPSIDEPRVTSNTLTADVQTMSPYINDEDEIIIPEATAVNPEDIPSATIVLPEKYSLTIAGHKIHFRFLALGAILILGATTVLAVTLTKNAGVGSVPDSAYINIPAHSPSSAPSFSLFPTLDPSTEPSTSPTSALQAELMDILLDYSEGNISSSFSDSQSKHRIALDWLVDDQSKWRDEKEPLPNAEIVERFVLALLYYETHGEEWFSHFGFMAKEHVCKWRGVLFRTIRKGVTSCTNGSTGRVKNLMLVDNNLRGALPAEIGLLKELTRLNLGMNDMHGGIPSTLGSLTNLTHLELNGNDFAGPIASLAKLSNLQVLDLSSNDITGSLMDASNLTNLQSFKVNGNKLSGSVPKEISNMSSLETLHLQWNRLSGNVDFLCKDLPSDYRFDCDGDKPEVSCTCCVGCTIMNQTECDPETEKLITLDIYAGNQGNSFEWQLKEENSGVPIAAGGDYGDGQQLGIQLCLSYPGWYSIMTSAPQAVLPVTPSTGSRISFAINNGYETSIGTNELHPFYVAGNPTSSPTTAPTISPRPTSSSSPTHVSSFWSTTASSNWATMMDPPITLPFVLKPPIALPLELIATEPPIALPIATEPPIALPVVMPPPCSLFELNLTTDAFGEDTSWEVFDKNKDAIIVSNSSFSSNHTFHFTQCLDLEGCYDFVIKDEWDDGICCQQGKGSYNVSVNGRQIGSGGEFGSSDTVFLGGSCGVNPTEGLCPEDYSLLNVTILTDWAGSYDNRWEVFDASTGQIYATNEFALEDNTKISSAKCIPQKDCYQFTIHDSYGDGGVGWKLEYDGQFIDSGDGNFGRDDSTTFGVRCDWEQI